MNVTAPKQPLVRILLATADPVLRESRRAVIEKFGYAVAASMSVEHAFALIRAEHFDLLILGHSLTSQECCSIAKEFRRFNPGRRVLEIASSGSMPPRNNPDATVVGLDGPLALRAIIEKQITAIGHWNH